MTCLLFHDISYFPSSWSLWPVFNFGVYRLFVTSFWISLTSVLPGLCIVYELGTSSMWTDFFASKVFGNTWQNSFTRHIIIYNKQEGNVYTWIIRSLQWNTASIAVGRFLLMRSFVRCADGKWSKFGLKRRLRRTLSSTTPIPTSIRTWTVRAWAAWRTSGSRFMSLFGRAGRA